jgi:K+ potassium transporter
VTIGGLGLYHVARQPAILGALSPHHGVRFFMDNGASGFRVLGGVVLAVTGGEALYADMGNFGRRPIRKAWLGLVYPALLLCYAALLTDPSGAERPFYALIPRGPCRQGIDPAGAHGTADRATVRVSGTQRAQRDRPFLDPGRASGRGRNPIGSVNLRPRRSQQPHMDERFLHVGCDQHFGSVRSGADDLRGLARRTYSGRPSSPARIFDCRYGVASMAPRSIAAPSWDLIQRPLV